PSIRPTPPPTKAIDHPFPCDGSEVGGVVGADSWYCDLNSRSERFTSRSLIQARAGRTDAAKMNNVDRPMRMCRMIASFSPILPRIGIHMPAISVALLLRAGSVSDGKDRR